MRETLLKPSTPESISPALFVVISICYKGKKQDRPVFWDTYKIRREIYAQKTLVSSPFSTDSDVTCNKTEFDPTIDYAKKSTLLLFQI
jgi:hypothetical protein